MPRVVSVRPHWVASYSTQFGEPYRISGRDYVTSRSNMLWQRRAVQRATDTAVGAAEYAPIVGLGVEAGRRAWGLAGRIVKRIKGVISRKPQSKFKQINMVNPAYYKRKRIGMRGSTRVKRQRVGDPASYRQLQSVRRKYGRKIRTVPRVLRLMRTVTEPIRYRWGKVQDINAATGSYWLTNQVYDANNRLMPVYLMPLFNVNQGAAADNTFNAGRVLYELVHATTGVFWRAVNGVNPNNTAAVTNSPQIVAPAVQASDGPNRRGLVDWTRVRLCFWGKKKNPSQVRVRLVRFLEEEFCPEFVDTKVDATGFTAIAPTKVAEYWVNGHLKYLLNGHMGAAARFDRKRYMKILKEWVIDINPVDAGAETSASDPRPHMKHLDIFNRWNRVNDYTDRSLAQPSTYADLVDVNRAPAANLARTGYLKNPEKQIYVLIESVEPVEQNTASTANPRPAPLDPDFSVSFDALFESNYTVVKE